MNNDHEKEANSNIRLKVTSFFVTSQIRNLRKVVHL